MTRGAQRSCGTKNFYSEKAKPQTSDDEQPKQHEKQASALTGKAMHPPENALDYSLSEIACTRLLQIVNGQCCSLKHRQLIN